MSKKHTSDRTDPLWSGGNSDKVLILFTNALFFLIDESNDLKKEASGLFPFKAASFLARSSAFRSSFIF